MKNKKDGCYIEEKGTEHKRKEEMAARITLELIL
jgi:hypothetical protein